MSRLIERYIVAMRILKVPVILREAGWYGRWADAY
jgi:hypothetical protein